MKNKLLKQHLLGKVKAFVYIVEFQKQGLPHAHFLLIIDGRYKLTCREQYERIISAEILDELKYPRLYDLVKKHMIHGPCGKLNINCPCTKGRDSCKNHYPWKFNEATMQGKDSYPLYRRRKDGRTIDVRKCNLHNRWVVSYNRICCSIPTAISMLKPVQV